MNKFFFILISVLISTQLHSQNNKTSTDSFKFEKNLINYGKIKKGSNGIRVFKFTNVGDEPIIITDVKTSCDCAVPKKPEDPIMPSESGEIEVEYDTKKIGGFSKVITIFYNDDKVKKIRIKGYVSK